MKKTQIIELFKNIKRSKISFISITMFIILGVAIYLGLGWTADGIKDVINVDDTRANAHDVELFFPYGITDEDVNKLNQLEDVENAEAYFVAYEKFDLDNGTHQAKIVSYNQIVDKLFDIEGRLPENDDEIVVEKGSLLSGDIKIGDTIEFYGDEANTTYLINLLKKEPEDAFDELSNLNDLNYNYLKVKKLKVVGIVESPEYISVSATAKGQSTFTSAQVSYVFFCSYNAFNENVTGPYNYVAITYKGLDNLKYNDDEYKEKVLALNEKYQTEYDSLSTLSYKNIENGFNAIDTYVTEKLDNAQKEIDDAKTQIADAEKKLPSAKKELDAAKLELDNGLAEIESGRATLNKYEVEYSKSLALVNKVKNTYERYKDIAEKGKDGKAQVSDILTVLVDEDIKAFSELLSNGTVEMSDADLSEFNGLGFTISEEFITFFYDYADYVIAYKTTLSLDDEQKTAAQNVKNTCTYDASYSGLSSLEKLDVNADKIVALSNESGGKSDVERIEEVYTQAKSDYDSNNYIYDKSNENYDSSQAKKIADKALTTSVEERTAHLYLKLTEEVGSSSILTIYKNAISKADQKLAEARAELDAGWAKLNDGIYLYEVGKIEYEKGLAEYNSGVKKLAQAKIDLENGEKEYADGKEQYKEFISKKELIKDYGTVSLTQEDNTAMMYDTMLSDIIAKVKITLGGLFLVIGLMVCYSSVTRMVNDDIKIIGTKKAVGFNSREIKLHYLAYTGMAVICGALIGLAIAALVVEPLIAPSVSGTFTFDLNGDYFDFKEFLYLFLIEFALIELITYLACNNLLKKNAITLLQGETVTRKAYFYENFGIYKKLSLLTKTIINNFVNDRSRIIATIIGVAGSTALIVSSLMMRNNVMVCFDKQFKDYFVFDSFIYFDQENGDAKENIYEVLDKYEITYTPIRRQFGYSDKENCFSDLFTYIMVYDDEDPNFEKLVKFESTDGKEFVNGETWLSNSIEHYAGLNAQDTINFSSLTGDSSTVDIDGFYNYYYYSVMMFMPKTTYEEVFNEELVQNLIIIDTDGIDTETLIKELKEVDGYSGYLDFQNYVGYDAEVFKSIANVIVGIYGAAACLMALFVILNLLITFVNEKKKELIVMMINGFSISQARRYIYSDTILLTIVGIILGIILGNIAGSSAISAFEGIYLYLRHEPNIPAMLIGVVFTSILTLIMSLIALKGIDKFKLTDINKD